MAKMNVLFVVPAFFHEHFIATPILVFALVAHSMVHDKADLFGSATVLEPSDQGHQKHFPTPNQHVPMVGSVVVGEVLAYHTVRARPITVTTLIDTLHFPTENPQLAQKVRGCLLYTSPSPRDGLLSRMPSSA